MFGYNSNYVQELCEFVFGQCCVPKQAHIETNVPSTIRLSRALKYQLLDGASDLGAADGGLGAGNAVGGSRVVVGRVRCAPRRAGAALGDDGDILEGEGTKVPVNIVPERYTCQYYLPYFIPRVYQNSQLNSKDSLVEALVGKSKVVDISGSSAAVDDGGLPVGAVDAGVVKSVGLALIRVEAAAPCQGWVRAAPARAKVPGARAAVEHVLVDAGAVGGLETGPEIVSCGSRQLGDDHGAGQLGEVGTRGRVVREEIPRNGRGRAGQDGEEGDEREGCGQHFDREGPATKAKDVLWRSGMKRETQIQSMRNCVREIKSTQETSKTGGTIRLFYNIVEGPPFGGPFGPCHLIYPRR